MPRIVDVAVHRHPGGPDVDRVVVEEPLEIRVEGVAAAVTMRTPGDDLDLVAGFLLTEGVIDGADDLRALAEVGENTVDVRLAEGVPAARARHADRALFASSSCGICGKASIDRIRQHAPPVRAVVPADEVLLALPGRLRAPTFDATGGLHAAALFTPDGAVVVAREDVGRHNAVDKVIGAALRGDGLDAPLGLLVTSRAGFEIVQKALVAGLGCVVVYGAPTSLAVELARESGLPLYAWLRPDRFVRHGIA